MSGEYIEIKALYKAFGKGESRVEVLKGIELEISKGEMVAVVGASGAGKSTMMHIVGGLEIPTSGEVFYAGTSLYSMNDKMLSAFRNREIGFVFQSHHLLPEFSALENVMMPALVARIPREEAREKASKILSRVGLANRTTHKPGELSGGEQQRVAISRGLVMNPNVLLADEPTGNLDSETGDEIFSLLSELNREMGITIVMVTHNEKLASGMGRQVTVRDGRIFF